MVFHFDGMQQFEKSLKMIIVCIFVVWDIIVKHSLFQCATESEDASTQQRLDDIGTERMVCMLVETLTKHLIEMGIELEITIFHRDHMYLADINQIIPNVYLLAQETL